jgi:hypothetical protein
LWRADGCHARGDTIAERRYGLASSSILYGSSHRIK